MSWQNITKHSVADLIKVTFDIIKYEVPKLTKNMITIAKTSFHIEISLNISKCTANDIPIIISHIDLNE